MNKKIILFGYGRRGKKFLSYYFEYGGEIEIVAVVDNNKPVDMVRDIPVILSQEIKKYNYDEVWLSVKGDRKHIHDQLVCDFGVNEAAIRVLDNPLYLYLLDERIRKKYREEIEGTVQCADLEKQEVIDFLKQNSVRMYCYHFFDTYMENTVPIFWDEEASMFYATYHSKRMYFARRIHTVEAARNYYNSIILEQDLLSPHRYLTDKFQIGEGEVGIDLGTAEGIFALDVVDNAEFLYLIEPDAEWVEALKWTFRDYEDKIKIIKAFVSEDDTKDGYISIDGLIGQKRINFIKMDIEGGELNALKGATGILTGQRVKLAVCSYHHTEDYDSICAYLGKFGYRTSHSKGYLICTGEWEKENEDIDFRRAIVFADKDGRI